MNQKKLRILVVEDHAPDRIMILNAIRQSGFETEVRVAENIDDALIISAGNSIDCIFLDYYFPIKNGIDFLRVYTSRGGTGSIIMVTSQDDVNMAVECMKMGASDYLTKNQITPASISKSLHYVLKLKTASETAFKAEQALLESELKLKSIIARSPVILFNIDQDGLITLYKGKAASLLNVRPEEVIGKSICEFENQLPIRYEDYKSAFRNENLNFKVEVNKRYFDVSYIPVKNELKDTTGMMGVAIDITTFKQNETDLKNTIEITETASKIKEQFLANMSHEIRTPIHGIISLTQFILNTTPTEEQKKYLELIRKSADTLKVIVDDILDLSKIDAEKMSFEEIQFNLKDTVQTTIASFIPKTIEKNIQIKTDFSNAIPSYLVGDPVRLTQIINNIIGNAIKFTEVGSVSLTVVTKEKNDEYIIIEFIIKDTGIGISPLKIGSIFDSFSQAESDTTRKYGGTGLGLSIAKKLIEKQNGQINVESKLGEGTQFTIQIPYKISKTTKEMENNTQEKPVINFEKKLRILVAEDNDINLFIIEKMLKEWNLQIDFATTGTEAVAKMKEGNFDLILMDVEMPDMNGYRATEIIRSELSYPANEIPIIAMTGHAMQGEREKCLKCGMNDYISKPFKPEELKEKISLLTKSKTEIAEEVSQAFTGDMSDIKPAPSKVTLATNYISVENKLTDMTFLKEISENNEQFFREFIQMFLTNTPKSIEEMKVALENSDWEKLRQASHKIKPSFNYVGLKELSQNAGKIEEYSRSGKNLEQIPTLLNNIIITSQLAFTELEFELNTIA